MSGKVLKLYIFWMVIVPTTQIQLRNECLFFWVHGEWIVTRDKQIAWTAKRFSVDLFVPRYDSFPMNPEKRHSFLIFTMRPTKTHSRILWEKLYIQNSHSNGHLTSFDVLITSHVIRPDCRTFCWLCSSGIELKNFSRVQRRKNDTIVNITLWPKIRKGNNSWGINCPFFSI